MTARSTNPRARWQAPTSPAMPDPVPAPADLGSLQALGALLCEALASITGARDGRLVYVAHDSAGVPVQVDALSTLDAADAARPAPQAWDDTMPAGL